MAASTTVSMPFALSCACSRGVAEVSRRCLGSVAEVSRLLARCRGGLAEVSRQCLGSVSRLEVSAREGVEAPFVLDDDVARLRLHGRVEVGVPAPLGEELVAGASREDAKPCPQTSVMKKNSTCRRRNDVLLALRARL